MGLGGEVFPHSPATQREIPRELGMTDERRQDSKDAGNRCLLPRSAPTRGSGEAEGMSVQPIFAPSMGRRLWKRGLAARSSGRAGSRGWH